MLYTRTFRCMTTDIELFLDAEDASGEAALSEAERFFRQVESRFSRFQPDSELSRLNAAAGGAAKVSADLAELIQLALEAAHDSGSVFDPTIIDRLEAAGYDRSIELVRERDQAAAAADAASASAPPMATLPSADAVQRPVLGRWATVRLDRQANTVALPAGIRLDLGGIGKGWAADRAASALRMFGSGLVSAGGDLQAWGDEPGAQSGDGWLVAVDHPTQPGADAVWLRARDCAVATSSVVGRHWSGGHHLIDPRSGRPAATDLLQVTVVGPTAVQAEVAAKVALILGREAGLAWLASRPHLEGLLAGVDGQFYGTRGISEVWI